MSNPSYYAVIPANVRYDNRLKPNEKLMYGEITALSGKNGVCFASNEYFAKLYQKTTQTITVWVSHLKKLGYIQVKTFRKGMLITKRCISITPISDERLKKILNKVLRKKRIGYLEKSKQGLKKNLKENNTSNNTIKSNIRSSRSKSALLDKIFAGLKNRGYALNGFNIEPFRQMIKQFGLVKVLKAVKVINIRFTPIQYIVSDMQSMLNNNFRNIGNNYHQSGYQPKQRSYHSYRKRQPIKEAMPEWSKHKDDGSEHKTDPKLIKDIHERLHRLGEDGKDNK